MDCFCGRSVDSVLENSDDYVHVDNAVDMIIENEWLTAEDIIKYILNSKDIEMLEKLRDDFKLINMESLVIDKRNEEVAKRL
jgi:hypothetical protein